MSFVGWMYWTAIFGVISPGEKWLLTFVFLCIHKVVISDQNRLVVQAACCYDLRCKTKWIKLLNFSSKVKILETNKINRTNRGILFRTTLHWNLPFLWFAGRASERCFCLFVHDTTRLDTQNKCGKILIFSQWCDFRREISVCNWCILVRVETVVRIQPWVSWTLLFIHGLCHAWLSGFVLKSFLLLSLLSKSLQQQTDNE